MAVPLLLPLGLVIVLAADAAGVTARLIVDLVEGGPETKTAPELLSTGFGPPIPTDLMVDASRRPSLL
jgi:hypothetical protein